MTPTQQHLPDLLAQTLTARHHLFDERHEAAFRLFNGFWEGEPALAVDLYGATLLIHNYADPPEAGEALVTAVSHFYRTQLPWLTCIMVKVRRGDTAEARNGRVVWGGEPTRWVREHGVRYALDLRLNRDASLYLDTRHLRRWLMARAHGREVLNTFAYTGSLGVAACAGGAREVIQTDLNKQFLNVGKTSYTLNGFPIDKKKFITRDFWPLMNRFKRENRRFDWVVLDPPFFSSTSKGTVDLTQDMGRLINKVRPLVRHGGQIIAINNALFVSGADYMAALETIMGDGYVSLAELVPVAEDFVGFPHTAVGDAVVDPAPFNHSTKIAVLDIRHTV